MQALLNEKIMDRTTKTLPVHHQPKATRAPRTYLETMLPEKIQLVGLLRVGCAIERGEIQVNMSVREYVQTTRMRTRVYCVSIRYVHLCAQSCMDARISESEPVTYPLILPSLFPFPAHPPLKLTSQPDSGPMAKSKRGRCRPPSIPLSTPSRGRVRCRKRVSTAGESGRARKGWERTRRVG